MATIMEKEVLIEKAAAIACAIRKKVRLTGETTTSKADFSLICESRQYLLESAPSDIDFSCWVSFLNAIKIRYEP